MAIHDASSYFTCMYVVQSEKKANKWSITLLCSEKEQNVISLFNIKWHIVKNKVIAIIIMTLKQRS